MAWRAKTIDVSNGPVTVSTVGVIVRGVYVNVTINASIAFHNGDLPLITIPAATAAGEAYCFAGEVGVLFDTNLVVVPDGAATGNVTVMFKDQK